MRKYLKSMMILLVMVFLFSFSAICFATDSGYDDAQVITDPSEFNVDDTLNGEEFYVDNYEDYDDLMNGQDENGYSQKELKSAYEEYQTYLKNYYKEYKRKETVKARVVEVYEEEEYYQYDDYYSILKYEIQPILVEVIEGEHAGERYNIDYLLTGDSLNNIRYSKVSVGDVISVGFYVDETTGETVADIMNTGANVERFGAVFCIGIIALLLVMVYAGKKGVIASLIAILVLDFCLVIIPNMGFEGAGFLIGGGIFTLLLIGTMTIAELGLHKKAAKAGAISLVITILTAFLIIAFGYLTRTAGITFEVAALSENVLLGNMNFSELFVVITMIIASVGITKIVCETTKRLDQNASEDFNGKLDACKDILGGNIIMVLVILLATYIPNHLLLLTNKYTNFEVLNSEILVVELLRVFAVIIAMSMSIPTVVALSKKGK